MAIGVTERDVYGAADRVLSRGERPTVVSVRMELGRGSPARVGAMLDAWWDALAKRLAGETRLPALPREVAGAFSSVWEAASNAAARATEAAVTAERDTLARQASELEKTRAHWTAELEAARAKLDSAQALQAATDARVSDLQRLLDEQQLRLGDAAERSRSTEAKLGELCAELDSARETLRQHDAQYACERAELSRHIRSVEERAAQEVDRAREEIKALQKRVLQVQNDADVAGKVALARTEAAQQANQLLEKRLVEASTRVELLTAQLARVDGLPAALVAAQQRADALDAQLRSAQDPRQFASKRVARAPRIDKTQNSHKVRIDKSSKTHKERTR